MVEGFVCLLGNYCYKIGFSIVNNSKKNKKMLRKEKKKKNLRIFFWYEPIAKINCANKSFFSWIEGLKIDSTIFFLFFIFCGTFFPSWLRLTYLQALQYPEKFNLLLYLQSPQEQWEINHFMKSRTVVLKLWRKSQKKQHQTQKKLKIMWNFEYKVWKITYK